MKKTLYINLNGYAFNIEEDAYEKLEQYLNKIQNSFADENEAKEIIADIEARIAEIFQGSHPSADEVITFENVEEVIKTMGEPQDIVGDEEEEEKEKNYKKRDNYTSNSSTAYSKRLYRDTDNRVFGGVCGGLGAYFGIDPLVFRIIFVVTFIVYGVSLLPYFILWIVMPKALTITQKLEMRGPADYEKWEQNIKNEYNQVRDSFKKSKAYKDINDGFAYGSDKMGLLLRRAVQIFGAVIGSIIMAVTLSGLISIVMSFTVGYTLIDFNGMSDSYVSAVTLFLGEMDITLGIVGLFLILSMPLLLLFFVGFKMVFTFKTRTGLVFLIGLAIWIGGMVLTAYSAAEIAREFREYESVQEKELLQTPIEKTLYIKPNKQSNYIIKDGKFEINQLDIFVNDEELVVQGEPYIEMVRGEELSINFKKSSRGRNVADAQRNCEQIEYFWLQNDSILFIDSKFSLIDGAKIRDQKLKVVITVPEGINVDIDDDLKWTIDNFL